ncbi:MAG: extracellular solute-binding protein, partial [Butyrivibrio sp.]|nr:extracellular solute-binding protein [Butyrivibrio sp.]
MKLFKKVAAVSLACCMVAGLAACGNSGTSTSSGGSGDSAQSGDIVKLVVWGNGSADTEDCNEVAEAISKITRDKIGVEIELVRGQDAEQINLALTSGEPIDLLCYNNISGQLATVVRNNWAYPLDDLVQQYGQGALGVINQYDLDACRANGVLVALPNQKDTSRAAGFAMRKDICDELGITVPEYGTYDEMHDILVKVHEAHPELYPLVPTWAQGGM